MPGSSPSRVSQSHDYDPDSPSVGVRPGPWPPRMEPLPADHSYNPRALGSWARRTGYKSNMSGESTATDMEINMPDVRQGGALRAPNYVEPTAAKDVEYGRNGNANGLKDTDKMRSVPPAAGLRDSSLGIAPGPFIPGKRGTDSPIVSGVQSSVANSMPNSMPSSMPNSMPNSVPNSGQLRIEPLRMYKDSDADIMSQSQDADDLMMSKHSHMKYELRETPGLFPLILYGIQHYFSMAGSLVLIPLVLVPAMGGSSKDTARVISSMLLVSGISTLLHSFFGSRLSLIQGASFVYLAPALAIVFSSDFTLLNADRFKTTMRELQGAIIIASAVQALLGYSGFMSILLRVINPVVVAPTVAAVGLAFFAYGFPVVGTCVEIGIPLIIIVVFFSLYLRKVAIFGHRIFQVYAVPLGLAIAWAYAFLLTESNVYTYKDCDFKQHKNVTAVLTPACQKHLSTMMHCRTDTSNALSSVPWFWFPYPFQWGTPTFHWHTGVVMIVASIIASVDSVGSYHAASLLVASRAPPPGVVSRSIGLEGLTSILAGFWGTGAGATTLTENVHTIAVTKMGSRHAVEFGASVLIVASIIGKIGGFIASIPQVIAAGLLVVMWTMLAALGLSNLRYSETGSSRNVMIVGLSLFLSLSVPAYFQQYSVGSNPTTGVPSYFQQYTVAAHGPFHTKFKNVNFVLNTILSLHMVIAFVVAFFLDNTVPGSRQERGIYVWSKARTARNDPGVVKDYGLPFGLGRFCTWVRWVGL